MSISNLLCAAFYVSPAAYPLAMNFASAKAVEALTGHSAGLVTADFILDRIHPQDIEAFLAARANRAEGEGSVISFRLAGPDGDWIDLQDHFSIRDSQFTGAWIGIAGWSAFEHQVCQPLCTIRLMIEAALHRLEDGQSAENDSRRLLVRLLDQARRIEGIIAQAGER